MNEQDHHSSPNDAQPRREFLKSAACAITGGCAMLAPVCAAIVVVLGPLRKAAAGGLWVNLAKLDSLSVGSAPQLFQVFVERADAWTKHARSAVGAVYVERLGERELRVFHSACPHLGCAVDWQTEAKNYYCPCHKSAFAQDGAVISPSPSSRGLDTLAVEIRGEGEVWVKFENFKAGVKEKIPVA